MSDTVDFTTRLPPELHAMLQEFCREHRWSMNTAIIALLEQSLTDVGTPQPARRKRPEGSASRATRLPEDFSVSPEMATWAREHVPGLIAAGRARSEHEKFIDHWRSASGASASKRDWVAAWRNWMRRADESLTPPQRHSRQQETDDQFARAMARIQAREDAAHDTDADRRARPVHQVALPPAGD